MFLRFVIYVNVIPVPAQGTRAYFKSFVRYHIKQFFAIYVDPDDIFRNDLCLKLAN